MEALVVEDRALVREGLCLLLEGMGLFERQHEAASLAEARQLLRALDSANTLVLLDLNLPDASALEALDGILAASPGCRVLICSGEEDANAIRQSFALGARGYVTKNASGSALEAAVRAVLRGDQHVPPEILAPTGASRQPQGPALTPRQRDVLRRVAAGMSNKEIASELGMSPATVRAHLGGVFRHLGVENRTQAATHPVAAALLHGVVDR